ncbi:MAG TPA: sel1 repeat family protein [Gammaproteobacteria bacterium]|nr:sel1 repeat family protein [Gammaproteobacteria bacterium]
MWIELSEKACIRSVFYPGACYDFGIGARKNYRKAHCNYLLAAEQGHGEAMKQSGNKEKKNKVRE